MNINSLIHKNYTVVEPFSSIRSIEANLIKDSFVVVMEKDSFIGLLTPSDILKSPRMLAGDCLHNNVTLEYGSKIETAFKKMKEYHLSALSVFRDGEFIGVVTEADIAKCLQEFYSDILGNVFTGVFVTDGEDRIFYVNNAFLEIFNTTFPVVHEFSITDDSSSNILLCLKPYFNESKELMKPFRYNTVFISPADNTGHHIMGWIIPKIVNDEYDGMMCTVEDISYRIAAEQKILALNEDLEQKIIERTRSLTFANEQLKKEIIRRKKIEEALIRSERSFSTLTSNSTDMIVRFDTGFRRLYCNSAVEKLFGVSNSELLGKTPDDIIMVRGEDDALNKALKKALKTGEVQELEQFMLLSSEERWFHTIIIPELDESEVIVSFLTITRETTGIKKIAKELEEYRKHLEQLLDMRTAANEQLQNEIYERKKIEEALIKSERDFSTLAGNSTDMIIRYDTGLSRLYSNPAVEKIFGIPGSEFAGKTPLEITLRKNENNKIFRALEKALETGEEQEVEQLLLLASETRWFQTRIIPERDETGEMVSLLSITREITGYKKITFELDKYQKHLELLVDKRTSELSDSEKRYREIIDSITDYVYQVKIDENKKTTTIYAETCFKVTGYHAAEFEEDHFLWLNIVYEEDRALVKNLISDINKEKEPFKRTIIHRIYHKDGSLRWIKNTIVIHKNPDGGFSGYDGVISDITEIKNAEDEIKQLNQNLMNAQEDERQRVSKDLHDGVGQTILAAKINIDAYQQNPVLFADRIDIGLEFLIKASQELREVYMDLYPTMLSDLGIEMTIRWLVKNLMKPVGISSLLNINLINRLPHELEINLYRIIQEIFSNILKHSMAKSFRLNLSGNDKTIKLTVKDNGIGIDPKYQSAESAGCGMTNMKTRVKQMNGEILIENNKPHGTAISIIINLSPPH